MSAHIAARLAGWWQEPVDSLEGTKRRLVEVVEALLQEHVEDMQRRLEAAQAEVVALHDQLTRRRP